MFDSVQLKTPRLDKEAFVAVIEPLREKLLDAQFELAQRKRKAILLLINGSDGAGKGETLNRIYEWLDDHFLETLSYTKPTDDERMRPPEWRYWRDMPAKGRIGLVLGGWHHRILRDRALGEMSASAFDGAIEEINRNEEMLSRDGVIVLKVWLHVDDAKARRRLAKLREADGALRRAVVVEWDRIKGRKQRARLNEAAFALIEKTSTAHAPWEVIAAEDWRYRDTEIARLLLATLERANAEPAPASSPSHAEPPAGSARPSLLASLVLSKSVGANAYAKSLDALQQRLSELTTAKRFENRGLVLLFEGNDAAGKGGAITRVRAALDPRRFRVHGVAAPTDEESARPYLWRFWRDVPRLGHSAIFDRSWYGRVLVERVERLCPPEDWMRAYSEINDFERQLTRANLVVVKFWMAIDPEEQLRRFREREAQPTKRYKLTKEDWRNREHARLYEAAANDMFDRTSTRPAPWTLVEANDKKFARLKVLRTIVARLEETE